jgi:hypothetical protein
MRHPPPEAARAIDNDDEGLIDDAAMAGRR